ncbi:MAG: 6,7-dimethyl-8-ribityllumazine synthase [Verrucomicrobiota bacterium]
MSTAQPIRPRTVGKASFSFAIVASQYNATYVQGLVEQAHREINELEPGAKIKIIWVPGAFEIPVMAKLALGKKTFHAVIALGVLLQGETSHALLVAQSVTAALQDIALEFSIPVINEVLLLQNEEQARARCLEPELNRGTEAARAAVSIVRTAREITSRSA